MSLYSPVDHGKRFTSNNCFTEIVEPHVALRHFHLEAFLILHTNGMPHPFSYNVADCFFLDVDDEGPAAAEFPTATGRSPALRYLHHQVSPLLSIRADSSHRPD